MSLKPSPINQISEETAPITRAVFPKGNRYMPLRDTYCDFLAQALCVLAVSSRLTKCLERAALRSYTDTLVLILKQEIV